MSTRLWDDPDFREEMIYEAKKEYNRNNEDND